MANPAIVNIKKDEWRKVATNVTSGNVWHMQEDQKAYVTYRMTGEAAPTDASEGVNLLHPGMIIANDNPVDVYVMALGDNGKVRVDV